MTRHAPKMIFIPYKIVAHPPVPGDGSNVIPRD